MWRRDGRRQGTRRGDGTTPGNGRKRQLRRGPQVPAPPPRQRTGRGRGSSVTRTLPLGRFCLRATLRARRRHCALSIGSRRHDPDGLPARLECAAARAGWPRLGRTPRCRAPGGILRRGPRGTGGTPYLRGQIAAVSRPDSSGHPLEGPTEPLVGPRSGVARRMDFTGYHWCLPACSERERGGPSHIHVSIPGAKDGEANLSPALIRTAVRPERGAGAGAAPAEAGGGTAA